MGPEWVAKRSFAPHFKGGEVAERSAGRSEGGGGGSGKLELKMLNVYSYLIYLQIIVESLFK